VKQGHRLSRCTTHTARETKEDITKFIQGSKRGSLGGGCWLDLVAGWWSLEREGSTEHRWGGSDHEAVSMLLCRKFWGWRRGRVSEGWVSSWAIAPRMDVWAPGREEENRVTTLLLWSMARQWGKGGGRARAGRLTVSIGWRRWLSLGQGVRTWSRAKREGESCVRKIRENVMGETIIWGRD
jgi:hypothetical protein